MDREKAPLFIVAPAISVALVASAACFDAEIEEMHEEIEAAKSGNFPPKITRDFGGEVGMISLEEVGIPAERLDLSQPDILNKGSWYYIDLLGSARHLGPFSKIFTLLNSDLDNESYHKRNNFWFAYLGSNLEDSLSREKDDPIKLETFKDAEGLFTVIIPPNAKVLDDEETIKLSFAFSPDSNEIPDNFPISGFVFGDNALINARFYIANDNNELELIKEEVFNASPTEVFALGKSVKIPKEKDGRLLVELIVEFPNQNNSGSNREITLYFGDINLQE